MPVGVLDMFKGMFTKQTNSANENVNDAMQSPSDSANTSSYQRRERSFSVPQPKSTKTKGGKSRNNVAKSNSSDKPIYPLSGAGPLARRHSSDSEQLVTQVDPQTGSSGNPDSSPSQSTRHRARATRVGFGQVPANSTVDELDPSVATTNSQPSYVILLYRDLSELTSTVLRSVRSGLAIMYNDAGNLRRRALHEASQLDTSKSIMKMQEKNERKNLVLWWRPLYTLWYFILECQCLLVKYANKLYEYNRCCLALLAFLILLTLTYNIDGQHQQYVAGIEKKILWWSYWVVLGIMSSVGLGTGLHTFVLYLGPFIAQVTLAAYECNSLDFPEPPYPSKIECPTVGASVDPAAITLWSIMSKVRIEAMMWGAGTAIGELPPYFMARAARLSGVEEDVDDEELEEVLDIEEKERNDPAAIKEMGIMERTKVYMHDLVHRVGFFGILACASIPNPLFDLAGITCGHFLVPFWTFFGATLIGKAVIKMHIQQLFVIFAFSQHHIELLIDLVKRIPRIGSSLSEPFREYLLNQRAKLHKDNDSEKMETPWLGWIFERLIIAMVVYFVISIINSFAQSYHKRLCAERRKTLANGEKLH